MTKHANARRDRFWRWMFDTAIILLIAGCVAVLAGAVGGCTYDPTAVADGPHADQPSCAELEPTCGASGAEDCCAAGMVPGGVFDRGRDLAADGMFTDTSHPATIHPFVLDTYEVTVGRFRQFVDAGMGTRMTPPDVGAGARTLGGITGQGGWQPEWGNELFATPPADLYADLACSAGHDSWTAEPGANESSAMSCVTWYEAFAFCVWDGGFLPTEAEWSYVAAGGGDQRAYPWSVPGSSLAVDCSFANYNIDYPDGFCSGSGSPGLVGSSPKGNGRWGHADLAGNVNEWVLDGYSDTYDDGPCDDCASLSDESGRVVRGSDWANASPTLRTGFRSHTDPQGNRDPKVGFRCARAVP